MQIKLLLILLVLLSFPLLAAESKGRFFLEGDGSIMLNNVKTGAGGTIRYRLPDGSYPALTLKRMNRIFGVGPRKEEISLRLIALLDYLQDHFQAGAIRILSGYRSPEYNKGLRRKGRRAARTSLHIEGMAVDIEMAGVSGGKLWHFVRDLNCCGAGYYHGGGIHIDTGPNRFWDETSTKVEQDLGAHNKLVLLRTDQDIYFPGEEVHLILARITDFPIGVRPEATLLKEGKGIGKVLVSTAKESCLPLGSRKGARSLSFLVPEGIREKGKMEVEVSFCNKPFPEMPDQVDSNLFQVKNTD